MYKVIRYFTDLQDNNYPYYEGNTFPREGLTVSKKRIEELSGNNNKQKRPLIELVKEEKKMTKTDINRMNTEDLRQMALNTGMKNAEDMTGKELKEYLIQLFGL